VGSQPVLGRKFILDRLKPYFDAFRQHHVMTQVAVLDHLHERN
jgi:hypothetical protein